LLSTSSLRLRLVTLRVPELLAYPGLRHAPPSGLAFGVRAGPHTTFYQAFVGEGTASASPWDQNRYRDFPDGTSNTVLFVEAAEAVPWTYPFTGRGCHPYRPGVECGMAGGCRRGRRFGATGGASWNEFRYRFLASALPGFRRVGQLAFHPREVG